MLVAVLVSMLPHLLYSLGGDHYFHIIMIRCFSEQLWQGDIYPRWCMNANEGLGSPLFLFYFPLPYYVTALFYPLVHWAGSVDTVYLAGVFIATLLTTVTCYHWLREITTPAKALLVSVVFLFLPYRMEAILFRAAYAEMWFMALLPLYFLYLRRGLQGKPYTIPSLAMAITAMCLTHIPATATALLAGSVYALFVAHANWRVLAGQIVAVIWGVAGALFYIVPALYYRQFMNQDIGDPQWANTFLSMNNITERNQIWVVMLIVFTVAMLMVMAMKLWRNRLSLPDMDIIRQEYKGWVVASIVALYLLLPFSKPIYGLMGELSHVVMPWRMQLVFMMAIAFMLAVRMQYLMNDRQLKTWKGDYASLMALLIVSAYLVTGIRGDALLDLEAKLEKNDIIATPEYRTRWTDKWHYSKKYFIEYANANHEKIQVIKGNKDIDVMGWSWRGITLDNQTGNPATLRLKLTYYPSWGAQAEDGTAVPLYPEAGNGQAIVEIPSGKHKIDIVSSVSRPQIWLGIANVLSIGAILLWLGSIYHRRKFNYP